MITSISNAQVKEIVKWMNQSRYRRKSGRFVLEGIKLVQEAAAFGRLERVYFSEHFIEETGRGRTVEEVGLSLFHRKDRLWKHVSEDGMSEQDEMPDVGRESERDKMPVADIKFEKGALTESEVLSDEVFAHISSMVTPEGVIGVARMPVYQPEELLCRGSFYLCLDELRDPGNLGTIFRTAEGAGVDGIFLSKGCVDLFNPKVVRATMGTVFRMPYCYVESLPEMLGQMREHGITIYGTMMDGSEVYYEMDYRQPVAVVIGNEANGISEEVAEVLTGRIRIPMAGRQESLNAAVSAAVVAYEAARQRSV